MKSISIHLDRVLALAMAMACVSCHTHNESAAHAEDESGHHHDKPGIVHMSVDDAARFGVSVQRVAPGDFCEAVRVTGEILPSSSDASVASAPTSGIFTLSSGVTRGASVKSGQTLGYVSSKGLSGGDPDVSAKVAVDNAKRELDRLKPLLNDGLVTRKEYNDALAAYNSAVAAYNPSAARGTVVSPRSGVVTDILVQSGQYVEKGSPVISVSGSGNITLRALLPASEASFISSISGAVITPHGAGSVPVDISDFGGRMISSSSFSAETPGYIPVYFALSSSAPVVPGTAAEVYLKGGRKSGILSVPTEAIGEQLGEKFVYLKRSDDDYEKVFVSTGRSDGLRTEILQGIAEGDSVVVGGLSFVRLAEQSTVVPEGHSHNH